MSEIKTMSGCILLGKCEIDWDIFRLQFFDDWKVEIEGEATDTELNFTINGAHILCMLVDGIVDLAIENASRNYSWADAASEIARHTAHVQLYITDCENNLQRHVLFSMIASSLLKQRYTIGLYQYPVTRKAEDYIEEAEKMAKDEMPVLSWIYIGLYQDAEGLWNAYTYGMEEFNKEDIEILHTKAGLIEMYQFMANTVNYLITTDDVLTPGQAIGSDDAHVYMVTRSEGAAIDGSSLKIEF